MRIVRSGAAPQKISGQYTVVRRVVISMYLESDTTDIPDDWRPANWKKQNGDISDCPFFDDSTGDPIICSQRFNDYEAGATAMLKALGMVK